MSNRKFNLDNEVQPEIHFRLLSISASKFENDWTSFPHSHHFTEIFFIKEGTGHMQIENESVPVSSNSLVVIGAQVTHTEFSDPKNPLLVLGEYRNSPQMGRSIVLYGGSILRSYGNLPDEKLKAEVRHILRHEFTHHLESLSGTNDLEIDDAVKLNRYKASIHAE